ncbi:MAG TPA: SCO family protein [Nannocystaceae bacterium]|nr:SCO family protein [Nannocystaceae bacterium]
MPVPPPDFVPTPWLVWLRKYIWVISGVLAIVTITALRPRLRHVPEPPPVMFTLPSTWQLVDHHERPFTADTLHGKVWVAGFVFTSCPSTCPAVTRAMGDLRERFDRMQVDVEMVSFTVDPVKDTPKVLADYAAQVGANDKWRFVTGDPEAIRTLVRDGFRLGIGAPEPSQSAGGAMYDIAHSTKLALVDGDGNVRGYYGIEPDEGLDEIFHRAEHVIAEAAMKAREQSRGGGEP